MTAILCNLPLECFEAREKFDGIELVTFGPSNRMWVDGKLFPFDVEFDASEGTLEQLYSRLPAGFHPDIILLYWPDQEPLPAGLEDSPVPVIGVVSDYNFSLPYTTGLWPFFDVLLVDQGGVELFEKLDFPDVRAFCQFTFKRPFHHLHPDIPRDVDIAFCGNLSPNVQSARTPWIERLRDLDRIGVHVEVATDIHGEEYGRFLNRARIGFNRSIRGEMNLRAFEVPACGALLLMEESNREVREFLTPDEEVVLYNDDNFEELVSEILADEPRRRRVAEAGHRRIQDYSMGKRLHALLDLLGSRGPGRPSADRFDCLLGRGVALLATWARGPGTLRPLVEAADLRPDDPRPLNALALALLGAKGDERCYQACQILERACQVSPTYIPAALNLLTILERSDRTDLADFARGTLEQRLAQSPGLVDLDGPVLGSWERIVAVAASLQHATIEGHVPTLDAWTPGRTLTPVP